jgi:hypothetical protein
VFAADFHVVGQTGMDSQKRQLEDALTVSGWRIADREPILSEWWADEIWTIESVWRPVGFTLFLRSWSTSCSPVREGPARPCRPFPVRLVILALGRKPPTAP